MAGAADKPSLAVAIQTDNRVLRRQQTKGRAVALKRSMASLKGSGRIQWELRDKAVRFFSWRKG